MKEFRCNKCKCYLGEMEKGKIKKGSVFLCTECMDQYKTFESLANYKKDTNTAPMPGFINDLKEYIV